MVDVWNSLNGMQQPCLRRPISSSMIGTDGLVRREILSSLDRLFCEHLAAGRASFQMPANLPAIPMAHRFINVSALQKAIRRGDAEGAMRFAVQGCGLDSEQIFRRLAVCAVEDVGIANLLAVGMALAAMSSRAVRYNGASDELAAYLAYILAMSTKSRLACDLLSIVDYDRRLDGLKKDLVAVSAIGLRQQAQDRSRSYAERMAAAWMLAGTARFRGTTMPLSRRPRTEIMNMMADSRMPLMLYYVADRAAARLHDAMFVSTFLVSEMLASDPEMRVEQADLPEPTSLVGFPAAAFDLHTYEGRIALSRFGRECPALAALLQSVTPLRRDVAVRHAVFIAEGGRLKQQLRFADADAVEHQAHRTELAFAGSTNSNFPAEIVAIVMEHLPALDQLRQATLI